MSPLSNATTLANYASGIGTQGATLEVDSNNKRVGIGTTNPQGPEGSLQVGTAVTISGNSGIVSATTFHGDFGSSTSVAGNLTVSGVITYEYVTNIDSVGIITARSGLRVTDSGSKSFRVITGSANGASALFQSNVTGTGDNDGLFIGNDAAATGYLWNYENQSLLLGTNNIERLRIDSSGRLLLGTTTVGNSLADDLTIASSGHTGMTIRAGTTASNSSIYFADGTSGDQNYRGQIEYNHNLEIMRFYVAAQERLRIDSSGVLTVGTTTAGSNAKFEVASTTGSISSATARINGGSTTTGAINTGASLLFAGHDGANGRDFASLFAGKENGTSGNHAAYLAFGTRVNGGSLTEKMRIDSSGHLLINKTTTGSIAQNAPLQVKSGSSAWGINLSCRSNNDYAYFTFTSHDSNETLASIFTQRTGTSQGYLAFTTNNGGTGATERMRISSAGNVGIGEYNPSSTLVVKQSGSTFTTQTQTVALFQRSSTYGHGAKIAIVSGNGSASDINFGDTDDEDIGKIQYLHTDNSFRFTTNASERMRITNEGEMYVTGGATNGSLHFWEGASVSGNVDTGRLGVGKNGNALIYTNASSPARTAFAIGSSGATPLVFSTNNTERMRIDSSGNASIGRSAGNARLDIYGTITTTLGNSNLLNVGSGAAAGYYHTIGLGPTINGNTIAPSAIGYLTEQSTGGTYGHLVFATRNVTTDTAPSERMRIDSSGKVIIGSTTAATNQKLTIRATEPEMALYATPGSSSILNMGDTDNYQIGRILYQNGDNSMRFYANVSERMRIDSSGRMGIGQASPQGDLHIGNISGSKDIIMHSANNGNARLRFREGGSNTSGFNEYSFGMVGNQNAMTFEKQGLGEVMRIDSSGNVKIVSEHLRFNTSGKGIVFGTDSGSNRPSIIGNYTSSTDNNIVFNVTGSGRMRIISGGQLLVGATALGTARNDAPVQIQTGTSGNSLNLRTRISDDVYAYLNFTNNAQTKIAASIHIARGSTSNATTMVLSTASSGTSAPTERVHIDSAGNFKPGTDNGYSMGASGKRWTAIHATNGTIQTSDQRDKTEIETSVLGTDFIKSLRPVSYKWKVGQNIISKDEDGETDVITPRAGIRRHWGFVAQEVKQSVDTAGVDFGGWVLDDKDDSDSQQSLRYDQFIAPLTKALQEAIAEIESLKAKVAALEAG